MRKVNDVLHNYTDIERKVRKATSGKPYGATGTVLGEIADATYDSTQFHQIMNMIWKRLNEPGKYWRHVYKALVLLEYVIKVGSDQVTAAAQDNILAIQTLKDFQHIDEMNKDQGQNVREKSKKLVILLKDPEHLREERAAAVQAQKRFRQGNPSRTPNRGGSEFPQRLGGRITSGGGNAKILDRRTPSPSDWSSTGDSFRNNRRSDNRRPENNDEEIQLAIDRSKQDAAEDERRRKNREENDPDLQAAIALSKVDAIGSESLDSYYTKPAGAGSGGFLLEFTDDDSSTQFDPFAKSAVQQQPQRSRLQGSSNPFGDDFNLPSQPKSNDPFGDTSDPFSTQFGAQHSQSTQMPQSKDMWGANQTSDPFVMTSQQISRTSSTAGSKFSSLPPSMAASTQDVWGQAAPQAFPATNQTAPSDPWGSPSVSASLATQAPSDPWSTPTPKAPAAAADPWGVPSPMANQTLDGQVRGPMDNKSAPLITPTLAASNDPWGMKAMESSLPATPQQSIPESKQQQPKKPDILERHKGLVNLDALMPTTQPMSSHHGSGSTPMNPFALNTMGTGMMSQPMGGRSNAFQTPASTMPMNQMRPMGGMGYQPGMQGMQGGMGAGPSGYGQQPMGGVGGNTNMGYGNSGFSQPMLLPTNHYGQQPMFNTNPY
eukprot:Ihof_evm7s63 gene=Ihof_evmTU7s63